MRRVLLSLPLLAATTGCASIIKGGAQDVVIDSNVAESKFEIRDNRTSHVQLTGQTPATIKLDRSSGYFRGASYTVTVSKDGYEPQNYVLKSSVNGWYLGGNLVFGGFIGYLIVDPATGAMWTLDQDSVHASLLKVASAAPVATDTPVAAAAEAPVAAEAEVPAAAPAQPDPVAAVSAAPQPVAPMPMALPVPVASAAPAVAAAPEPTAPAAAAPAVLAQGGSARLRAGAAVRTRGLPDADTVKTIAVGDVVTLKLMVRNATGAWWYVKASNGMGWARVEDLEPVPAI